MNEASSTVLLTRRRWGMYMLPALLIAILSGFLFDQIAFVPAGAQIICLWGILGFATPRTGTVCPTISSIPGMGIMLATAATVIGLMVALVVVDWFCFGHALDAPLKLYHAILFAPLVVVLLVGTSWADKYAKRKKVGESSSENGVTDCIEK